MCLFILLLKETFNDAFLKWLEKTYSEDGVRNVKTTRGKKHNYLAMILDFTNKGKLTLDMCDYAGVMCTDFAALLPGNKLGMIDTLFLGNTLSKMAQRMAQCVIAGTWSKPHKSQLQ